MLTGGLSCCLPGRSTRGEGLGGGRWGSARAPAPPPSFEEAAEALASLLDESVRRRVQGQGRVAVSFSGGLDSSLLALLASRYADVVLCSAYASGSRDEGQSERAAGLLGLKLETGVLDEETLAKGVGEAPSSHRETRP